MQGQGRPLTPIFEPLTGVLRSKIKGRGGCCSKSDTVDIFLLVELAGSKLHPLRGGGIHMGAMSIDQEMTNDCTVETLSGRVCYGRAGILRLHTAPGMALFLYPPEAGCCSVLTWDLAATPACCHDLDWEDAAGLTCDTVVLLPCRDQWGQEYEAQSRLAILGRLWRYPDAIAEIHFVDEEVIDCAIRHVSLRDSHMRFQ